MPCRSFEHSWIYALKFRRNIKFIGIIFRINRSELWVWISVLCQMWSNHETVWFLCRNQRNKYCFSYFFKSRLSLVLHRGVRMQVCINFELLTMSNPLIQARLTKVMALNSDRQDVEGWHAHLLLLERWSWIFSWKTKGKKKDKETLLCLFIMEMK